jgi:hypothetical protein
VFIVVVVVAFQSALGEVDEFSRVDVPGSGEVELTETGTYRVFYESTQYFDTGVCETRRTGTGTDRRTRTSCDAAPLRVEEPRIAPSGGDALTVRDDGGFRYRHEGFRGIEVFAVEIDEPGSYEVTLDDPPLGTERVALGPPGEGVPGWAVALLAVSPLAGLAALVLGIVTLIRWGRRGRRGAP